MSDGKSTGAWLGFASAIIVALIGGAVAIYNRQTPPPPPSVPSGNSLTPPDKPPVEKPTTPEPPPKPLNVMAPLQPGVNLQGLDYDGNGRSAPNAETCAEMCRGDSDCKAMTYVISLKTCWLKRGVPAPFPPGGPDYVSSVKQ